ncbi:MAG TPA: deoxyribose-phosphate aldolase, partial [Chthoniobacterales bacterium]
MTPRELAPFIDHTLLKADAVEREVIQLCEEAERYGFASVCVNGAWVPAVAAFPKVRTTSVVGFPLGAMDPAAKAAEAARAVELGADEIDMVLAIGWLKERRLKAVEADIRAVVDASGGRIVKVILETCLLTDEEKRLACQLSVSAGAAFVKTSTGFGKSGATVGDIRLMRAEAGPRLGVKASGGVRDY